jgi:hypothetical protein
MEALVFSDYERSATSSKEESIANTLLHCDSLFERLDLDRDGYISTRELNQAVISAERQDRETLELVVLAKAQNDLIKGLHNDGLVENSRGISKSDLSCLSRLSIPEPGMTDLLRSHDRLQRMLASDCASLFAHSDKPLKDINMTIPEQGIVGDCYLISALASVAKTHPEVVEKAIQANGDGSYTVTFAGDSSNPILVPAPTEAERALFASGGESGIWPLVIEKALGERRRPNAVSGDSLAVEYLEGGGNPAEILKLLTGQETDSYIVAVQTPTDIHELLQLADSTPMVAGTNGGTAVADAGLVPNHAYSVVGYNPTARTVTLRNPYGHGEPGGQQDGKDDGIFSISLSQFCHTFTMVSAVVGPNDQSRPRKVPSFG